MSDPNPVSFESAITELETLVAGLERNDGSLDDSIATFRRATELAAACRDRLESAQLRITELMPASIDDDIDDVSDDEDEETDGVPF